MGSSRKNDKDEEIDSSFPRPYDEIHENSDGLSTKVSHTENKKFESSDSKSKNSTNNDKSLSDLKLLLNVFDNPIRYNVNMIRDPIRQCKRISSVHLGDHVH